MRIRVLLVVLCLLAPIFETRAEADGSSVVVSEIYGGGGNTGATYANDYVELFNATRSPVDLTGWIVQYAPSTSNSWSSVPLGGSLPSYRHYLVRLGSGGTAGSSLPGADATGSTNMARGAGKVRLVDPTTRVVDLVGYGDASGAETAPAAGPADNTQSVTRLAEGCTDSGDNSADFEVAAPSPQNSSATPTSCGSAPELDRIGNKTVEVGQQLRFTVTATDPDGDPLTYSASGLPSGANFDSGARTFSWSPSDADVGTHRGVGFQVSDGFSSDSEEITIDVTRPRAPSQTTLSVTRDRGTLVAFGSVWPDHPGQRVTVRLFLRTAAGTDEIDVERVALDARSSYSVSFARPRFGRCRVRATFGGDADHLGSRAVETFEC